MRSLSLSGLVLLAACAQETVAHQQTENNANEIQEKLMSAGLDVSKTRDEETREVVFNIMVPSDQTLTALKVLKEHGLPKTEKSDSSALAGDGGLIPTVEQERMKAESAVMGDIENHFRRIPDITDASAVVSIPPEDPLRDINEEPPKAKAAVIIQYRVNGNGDQPPIALKDVQSYVAGRLAKLNANEVHVTMIPNRSPLGNGGGTAKAPLIDPGIGCQKKERILNIDVCDGNKQKVINIIIGAVIIAGLLAGMAVIAVLRAMSYRKDLTRLTAQFERHRK